MENITKKIHKLEQQKVLIVANYNQVVGAIAVLQQLQEEDKEKASKKADEK